ncbi:MAG TPA: hypothetical protein VGV92_06875 [Gammaproteobacteria bacterium]|nr:hypothetical protein [Gammaproteobacteria bacterium]
MNEEPENKEDIELDDAAKQKRIELMGKKKRQRLAIRTTLYAIGQAIFGGFLTIGRLGLTSLVKYVVSAASIPFEIINLIAEVDTLIEKESAPAKIAFVIILGVGSMAFLAIVDAVKWGGYQAGFLASVAASGPFVFTGILSLAAVLSVAGLIKKAVHLYKNPEYRTPLRKIGLTHKAIKTVGLVVLAVSVALFAIVFSAATVAGIANPIGATIALTVIGVTVATMVTMKIIKTVQENRAWKKTIEELKAENKNPYDVINPDRYNLHLALKYDEERNKRNFLVKLKDTVLERWRGRFGTVEQKAQVAADKEKTVSAVLKRGYEDTLAELMPTKKVVNDIKEKLEAEQKKVQPDQAVIKNLSSDLAIAEKAFKTAFEDKLKNQDETILKLQASYDLVRKPRGRLLFQEAVQKACAEQKDKKQFGNAAESDVKILGEIEASEFQEALQEERALQAKKDKQTQYSAYPTKKPQPASGEKGKEEKDDDEVHVHPGEGRH